MFIKLELFEEEASSGGVRPDFGSSLDARLDMKKPKPVYLPINLASIISFEHIKISTIGRPNTLDNKSDMLHGVRILTSNGSTQVVITDTDPTFEEALLEASRGGKLVHEYGRSAYMVRFAGH